jgi:hypothetical protein
MRALVHTHTVRQESWPRAHPPAWASTGLEIRTAERTSTRKVLTCRLPHPAQAHESATPTPSTAQQYTSAHTPAAIWRVRRNRTLRVKEPANAASITRDEWVHDHHQAVHAPPESTLPTQRALRMTRQANCGAPGHTMSRRGARGPTTARPRVCHLTCSRTRPAGSREFRDAKSSKSLAGTGTQMVLTPAASAIPPHIITMCGKYTGAGGSATPHRRSAPRPQPRPRCTSGTHTHTHTTHPSPHIACSAAGALIRQHLRDAPRRAALVGPSRRVAAAMRAGGKRERSNWSSGTHATVLPRTRGGVYYSSTYRDISENCLHQPWTLQRDTRTDNHIFGAEEKHHDWNMIHTFAGVKPFRSSVLINSTAPHPLQNKI